MPDINVTIEDVIVSATIADPSRTGTVSLGTKGDKGDPGAAGSGYDFVQASPASEWIINHNLGFNPNVQVFSVGGLMMLADVQHFSLNQTRVYHVTPTAGKARLA